MTEKPTEIYTRASWRALVWMIIMVIVMAVANPIESGAAKKRSTKAKTTATTRKKSTGTSGKKSTGTAKKTSGKKTSASSKRRRSSSRKGSASRRRASSASSSRGSNWALTAADVNPDSKSPEVKAKKSAKRQVTVVRPDLEAIRVATLD
ncbi:MAG: hypothetical protein K2H22_07185, partial [Muribaculaceae bacterium]|nr:hypothetical protein [Muribaculaceae bacterium]